MTTIKVPMALRDRLRFLAERDGLTLAQEIEQLIDSQPVRPLPSMGIVSSGRSMTAEEIDEELAAGFGR